MYDAIHIEVQIVELFSIGIWLRGVNGNLLSIDFNGLLFNNLNPISIVETTDSGYTYLRKQFWGTSG